MKSAIIVLLALWVLEVDAIGALTNDIPHTNQVIMRTGQWRPSLDETDQALAAVQAFLENPTDVDNWQRGEIKKILENTKQYAVQFTGVTSHGKKFIRCNFFPSRMGTFSDWNRHEVEVMDGGYWYWRIEYDVETGKCRKFRSNGYA